MNRLQDQEKHAQTEVDAAAVADFLRRHPDFFATHPQLLADMRLPHHTGGAVSLVERQLATLRDLNAQYKKQLNDLIQIAKENDQLNGRLHELTLHLMEGAEFDAQVALIVDRLRRDYSADAVSLHLLSPPRHARWAGRPEFVQDVDGFRVPFQRLLSGGRPFCGRLKDEQFTVLFGAQAGQIRSAAVLPLGQDGDVGLLAIGSLDERRFQPSADTAFLQRMAQVIAAAVSHHLQLG